jgi:hypothetical protein
VREGVVPVAWPPAVALSTFFPSWALHKALNRPALEVGVQKQSAHLRSYTRPVVRNGVRQCCDYVSMLRTFQVQLDGISRASLLVESLAQVVHSAACCIPGSSCVL